MSASDPVENGMTGLLALASAAIFFGAAIYINVAEQPARLGIGDEAALAEWLSAYKRGYLMQASLAILSGLLGIASWWRGGDPLWLIGAGAMLANWPYTLVAIMPVNNRLEAALSTRDFSGARAQLIRWGRLHAGRSSLSAVAVILYLIALR
jgi:hypothetical protein